MLIVLFNSTKSCFLQLSLKTIALICFGGLTGSWHPDSVCANGASYTRSTVADRATKKSDDGYVNFMNIDKSTANYDKIVAKAASMNINVVNWEKEKWGEGLMVFYRQMYIKNGFQYSVQNIPAYPPLVNGRPDQSVPIKPENMAHITLGEHGPSGMKLPAAIVLSDAFNYNFMRMPNF